MIMQDNFEADDLFYAYCITKYLRNAKGERVIPFDGIALHFDDRDILGCLMLPSMSRIGLTAKTPVTHSGNYTAVLTKSCKYPVVYNSILPYNMFFGKQSNNLSPMKTAKPLELYLDFLEFTSNRFKPELFSTEIVMNAWLENLKQSNKFSIDVITEVEKRKPVVYPRLTWNPDIAIIKGNLNKQIAEDYLSLLDERNLLQMYKLRFSNESYTKTYLLDKWISIYRSGVCHIDNNLTADSTFFFNGADAGNVGGF